MYIATVNLSFKKFPHNDLMCLNTTNYAENVDNLNLLLKQITHA